MSEKKLTTRIQQKTDTKANWDKATNFVPLKGEYIYYSDLHRVKVGDGVTKVGSLPFLADSDSHYTTHAYVGATNANSNAATTNGSTYLKVYDDSTKRAEFKIVGSGATKVSSDASGNITISSTDTNTDTKVTSAANHYTPTADSSAQLSADASSTTAATWNSTSLVTGVNLQRDAKGHVTGVTVDSIKMPANPNTDTHFTTGLYVGKANEKSNSATTNGNTYLKLFDNDTKRSQHLINGSGATTVTSNAGGSITVATPIKNLDTTSGSGLGNGGSENIAGSGTIYLHKVAKTGSYNDLVNKPKIPTNVVTIDTEQRISGKKYFENDVNFGKWVSPIRQTSDAPEKLNLMSSAQTTAGFFDTVIFAGAGDWLYLGHLKPTFSIKASFRGDGEESDAYSASLGYTRGWLDYLTDWDYQNGWLVRPTKVSATTPAIIQIKFTQMLYTDVLRLILTGHNLNDSSGNYSGFLDDYTIEVCTDYAKDTWTTVVNRTNASDNIGKGLIYALQTGSYTECYGIRLKITKCHVNGQGYAYIKITSMQLRDYRPGIKFPDCLGAISQAGGDVWGMLNIHGDLNTHNVLPYETNKAILGTYNKQYQTIYSHYFYEDGTKIADKYLAKGTSSTVVGQIVYNPVEMKKALIVPSIQGTKYTDNSGAQHSLFELGGTADNISGSSSLTFYRNRAGTWDSATIAFTLADGLKIGDYVVGVQSWASIPSSYILTNKDGVTKDVNGCVRLTTTGGTSDDFSFNSFRNGKLHSKITVGNTGPVGGGWCIDNSKILTESSLSTQQWKLTSTAGTVTTVNICTK